MYITKSKHLKHTQAEPTNFCVLLCTVFLHILHNIIPTTALLTLHRHASLLLLGQVRSGQIRKLTFFCQLFPVVVQTSLHKTLTALLLIILLC